MRILMHCIYFPPEVGGLESHVHHLAKALVVRGHPVTVITSRSLPDAPPREEMDGIQVVRTWFPSRSPSGWVAHAFGSVPATLAEARRGVDILHAQAFASVPPLLVARRVTGAPLVATFHTSHFLVRARRPAWRPILRRLVRGPDRALAASTEIARVAEELAPGTRVEALTNGVDTELFRPCEPALPPGAGPRIVVPRRLFPKNGVDVLLRALPRIVEEVPGVEAVMIGDGPERRRLESMAVELGVGERVRFLGAQPNARMPALLSSAQVAVIPSRMEATSVAALEAMACGLPVVASEVGGLPEIVDGGVGRLVPPGEPLALAEAVVAVLRSPDRAALGAEARRRVVERWSNDRLAEHHLEIYRELVGGRAGDR